MVYQTGLTVVIGNGYYGSGKTLEEAKKRFRYEGGKLAKGYDILTFDAQTEFHFVDQMGRVHYFTQNLIGGEFHRPPMITTVPAKPTKSTKQRKP